MLIRCESVDKSKPISNKSLPTLIRNIQDIFSFKTLMQRKWKKIARLQLAIQLNFVGPTAGVNFINILCWHFWYESASCSFSLVCFGFVIFWQKSAHKMLMKLTTARQIFAPGRALKWRPIPKIKWIYGQTILIKHVSRISDRFDNMGIKILIVIE